MAKYYYNPSTAEVYNHGPGDEDKEHPGFPFFELTADEWAKSLSCIPCGMGIYYEKGKIVLEPIDDEQYRRSLLLNEADAIKAWFSEYDIQVSQYFRSQRTMEAITLEIAGITYPSIADMDAEATKKQERIREIEKLVLPEINSGV